MTLRSLAALLALLLPMVDASAAPAARLVYFDNDFFGPGQSNLQALIPLLRQPA